MKQAASGVAGSRGGPYLRKFVQVLGHSSVYKSMMMSPLDVSKMTDMLLGPLRVQPVIKRDRRCTGRWLRGGCCRDGKGYDISIAIICSMNNKKTMSAVVMHQASRGFCLDIEFQLPENELHPARRALESAM